MSEEFDDLEFLLPSELLTDDDLLTDFKIDHLKTRRIDDFSFGFGDSFGFGSDLSSPVESLTGTIETESDELDFVAELTRKVSISTLQEQVYTSKGSKLSSSPQSTLCGYKPGSTGSPNSASGVCSPPDANDVTELDLLYAAAGEVARLQMIEETAAFCSANPFAPPPKRTAAHQNPMLATGFYHYQHQKPSHLSYEQLQAAKFRQMKQYQMMNNCNQGIVDYQLQNRRNGGVDKSQSLSTSCWPTLQQSHPNQHQPGSGMRAVFLGENGVKKERIGTGVFMPRRFDANPIEPRKKTAGYSAVLLPEKVVHALNLKVDSIRGESQIRSNAMVAQQRRNLKPHPVIKQELCLPQEWTY